MIGLAQGRIPEFRDRPMTNHFRDPCGAAQSRAAAERPSRDELAE
jgi:hypothetical protein